MQGCFHLLLVGMSFLKFFMTSLEFGSCISLPPPKFQFLKQLVLNAPQNTTHHDTTDTTRTIEQHCRLIALVGSADSEEYLTKQCCTIGCSYFQCYVLCCY